MSDTRQTVSAEQMAQYVEFEATFKTVEGSRVLGVLDFLFNSRTSFDPDSTHTTAFHEGRRDVVLFIKEQMRKARACRVATDEESTYLNEGDE